MQRHIYTHIASLSLSLCLSLFLSRPHVQGCNENNTGQTSGWSDGDSVL